MLDIATRQQKAHPIFSFMLQLFNSCREFLVLWNPRLAVERSLYRSAVRNHPFPATNVSWLYIVLGHWYSWKFPNYSNLGTCCAKHVRDDGTRKIYKTLLKLCIHFVWMVVKFNKLRVNQWILTRYKNWKF